MEASSPARIRLWPAAAVAAVYWAVQFVVAQLDWATPISRALGGLKFHAQFTTGYGATLLDYNHRQWTAGIGVSFGD